ncbi:MULTISPECIES: hypothetical protein [Metabacillus]|uniref:hypothetical protein n=1 Tax=Metabacillus TaxID=2675233 RepID=UPI000C808750|nr:MULTISPECIES: hypothetical protein [Metabacillus]MCM3443601.1 prokaryotic E2 ligase family D protein [Metabacillus halosaccharovorans]PMC34239.1 hypothetical protein CJ195_24285 [Bacillus sp. UMB0899]
MEFLIKLTDRLRNFSDYVSVSNQTEQGVVLGEYRMTLSDVIKCLTDSGVEGTRTESPFLPKNCIKLVTKLNAYEVFIEIPKRQWLVTYNQEQHHIGFPRMVLRYDIFEDQVRSMQLVAVREEKGRINGETPLYFFPFSNVDKENSKVCMGNNQVPAVKCLSQLDTMHNLFFSAPFGDDYGCITSEGQSMTKLFSLLKDTSFNDEWLVPIGTTFNEYFSLDSN